MKEYTIGNLDNRQLHIRTYGPWELRSFHGGHWRLKPALMLNPRRWFKVIMNRDNWYSSIRRYVGSTHRCYCPTGSSIDGRIVVCGFGLSFWYSRFTGDVPCACDEITATLFEEAS